ncbi:outer membrane protein assembly factor BamC [Gallaecimonas kandeliae]|uniref:outer membrane protein assembly factor BamC n=1 Tax=Gallaecimonas kandeliae TaxID=3029055 RepID=UPI002649D81F|nr:outer membrane protein assembly factor BamC [Gallaecimonas kandeliae]WKE66892.1 outer membrane protein assembly factor BamC [Gallaecimonas kandeliae]
MTIRKTTLALAVIALAGCSSTMDKRQADGGFAYADVKPQPPLQAPAGLHPPKDDGKYAIPQLKGQGPVGKELDIRAPRLVLTLAGGSRLEESESGSKVEIDATDGVGDVVAIINSRLDEWLKARNIPVDKRTGTDIDTGWFVPADQDSMMKAADDFPVKRRFAIHIEAPAHKRSAVVTVKSLGAEKADDDEASIGSGERASVAVLNDYLAFYAGKDTVSQREMALSKYRPIAVTLSQSGEVPAFTLGADFERAWSRLPMVLEHLGFAVKDIDKSLGTIFVSYEGNPDSSFWSGLFGGGGKDLSFKHGKYQVLLGEKGENTSMTITDKDGQPLAADKYSEMYNPFSELMADPKLEEFKK